VGIDTESRGRITAVSSTDVVVITGLRIMVTCAKVTRVNSTQVGVYAVSVASAFTNDIMVTDSYSIVVGKVIMSAGIIVRTERHKISATSSRTREIEDLLIGTSFDENLRSCQGYVAFQSNTESAGKGLPSRIGAFEFDAIKERGTTDTGISTHSNVGVAFLRGDVADDAIVIIGPVLVETDAKVTDGSRAIGSDGIAESGGLGGSIDCVGTQGHSDWGLSGRSGQSYAGYQNQNQKETLHFWFLKRKRQKNKNKFKRKEYLQMIKLKIKE
jgi:hypothetical protein